MFHFYRRLIEARRILSITRQLNRTIDLKQYIEQPSIGRILAVLTGVAIPFTLLVIDSTTVLKGVSIFNWLPVKIFAWLLLSANTALLFASIFVAGYMKTRKAIFIEAEQVAFTLSFLLFFVALLSVLV